MLFKNNVLIISPERRASRRGVRRVEIRPLRIARSVRPSLAEAVANTVFRQPFTALDPSDTLLLHAHIVTHSCFALMCSYALVERQPSPNSCVNSGTRRDDVSVAIAMR